MTMAAKDHSPYGEQKPNGSGEFIEHSSPAELEADNVDEKALVRKV